MGKPKVAVVGAGVLGLVAVKNLLEEGFDVIAYEKNDYVGGLWRFSENKDTTSATEDTQWNSCSQMSCYTDFPFPAGSPDYPSLPLIQSYVESYCDHFSLFPHIKLGHSIQGVRRDVDDTKWIVTYNDSTGVKKEESFDEVIMAVGQTGKRYLPIGIAGIDNFQGQVLHGQSFKRGSDFKNKRVLILGSSNTAMDSAVALCGHAEKVYISHRHGGTIIPRWSKNSPVETSITLRLHALSRILGKIAPSQSVAVFNNKCLEISKDSFGSLAPEWRFNAPPKGRLCNPIINDKIVDLLKKGEVSVVQSMQEVLPSGTIKLADGSILADVDTIILCTGYQYDFSLVPESISPIRNSNTQWDSSRASNGRPIIELYQGIFSLEYPDSLAFLGVSGFPASQMPLYDLITMAITQIWKGAYQLPARAEMEAEVRDRHAWLIELGKKDGPSILPGLMEAASWTKWLHEVAGTGVNENLGYGLRGWKYWLKNMSYCRTLMGGVNSPHLWRLFDGRRKKWDGAKEAILRVNEEAKERKKGKPAPSPKSL